MATVLYSHAMPIVRYRVADLVTRGPTPCPCSAPFSTLLRIKGRDVDWFPLTRGRKKHGFLFGVLIGARSWVRRFQVVQERLDSIQVNVVPKNEVPDRELESIQQVINAKIGRDIRISVSILDNIRRGPGGKTLK